MYRAPPNFEAKVYPAHKVAALVSVLVADGVPVAEALTGSGITESRLRAAATRISYRQMLAVFRNALRLSSDTSIALRAGQLMHVTAYGIWGYALLSCPTHADSIDFAVKYHRVMGPVAELGFFRDEDNAVFTYEPILAPDPTDDLYRFAMEFQFSSHLTLNADLYGAAFKFTGVSAAYPGPAHARLYKSLFKCPVLFNQPANELRVDAAWVNEPIAYADPITNDIARQMCEQGLVEVSRAGDVAPEVHRILIERPGRFPDINAMAAELSMNTRTLRRKLDAEQTSYRKILAEVRMRLAIDYLRKTSMTNEEIATRLGYSDAANFRHAFTRWTFKSPSDFRGN